MSNGKSRAKGKRGELDVMHKLGGSAKRTGHAFSLAPDVCTKFGAYSIKNKTLGGGAILDELIKLQTQAPQLHHFVVFKPKRGIWVIAELLTQHVDDHGDEELRYGRKEFGNGASKSESNSREA